PALSFSFRVYVLNWLIWFFSTRSINRFCIVRFLSLQRLVWLARAWSAAGQGLFVSPASDGRMVAAQQDLGHLHAAEDTRPGVLRILQSARLVVRLLG